MLIENPKTEKEIYIYSAILKFTKKNGHVSDKVRVIIRSSKKGGKRKKDLPIPKEINIDDLAWKKYRGQGIVAVYHRDGDSENYDYAPKGEIPVPTALCSRLEGLVKEVCFENSEQT
jgi:hypothetical protein